MRTEILWNYFIELRRKGEEFLTPCLRKLARVLQQRPNAIRSLRTL
jgi:hypothetical protein